MNGRLGGGLDGIGRGGGVKKGGGSPPPPPLGGGYIPFSYFGGAGVKIDGLPPTQFPSPQSTVEMMEPYPSDDTFYATQLSEEERTILDQLSPYANYQEIDWLVQSEIINRVSKCRKALAIIVEQERPQSTEQEEKSVNYWSQQLTDFRMKEKGESYLLYQKEQIEAKYRAAMADIDAKLQLCRANYHQKETFYSTRLQNAEQTLNDLRSKKSKPRIRAEMELADAERPMMYDKQHSKMRDEYKVLKAKLDVRKKAWKDGVLARREAAYQAQQAAAATPAAATAAPKPALPKPVKKMVKKVAGYTPPPTTNICAYQYTVSQTDGNGVHTTASTSFAMIPWSPMACLA